MSDQERESSEPAIAAAAADTDSAEAKTTEPVGSEEINDNEKTPALDKSLPQDANEPETTARRIHMPQDIRYSTEQGEREKLMEKYSHYQVSDTNACTIRFLMDHRQKRNLFDSHEGTEPRFEFSVYLVLQRNTSICKTSVKSSM